MKVKLDLTSRCETIEETYLMIANLRSKLKIAKYNSLKLEDYTDFEDLVKLLEEANELMNRIYDRNSGIIEYTMMFTGKKQ